MTTDHDFAELARIKALGLRPEIELVAVVLHFVQKIVESGDMPANAVWWEHLLRADALESLKQPPKTT
jgi:hypothetical protein